MRSCSRARDIHTSRTSTSVDRYTYLHIRYILYLVHFARKQFTRSLGWHATPRGVAFSKVKCV